jgi:major membrane immunogen (membrane-anchored lipoprotein)
MHKLLCGLALAGAASLWSVCAIGQTKIAWSDSCGKADPDYTVQVGDPANHTFGMGQLKCHPTKPAEIGGAKLKEGLVSFATVTSGDKSREHGIYVLSLESGDKVSLPYQATITIKDGKPTGVKGTWSFGDGTGKLKGSKGKGSVHCAPAGDGWNCNAEGEYELAK